MYFLYSGEPAARIELVLEAEVTNPIFRGYDPSPSYPSSIVASVLQELESYLVEAEAQLIYEALMEAGCNDPTAQQLINECIQRAQWSNSNFDIKQVREGSVYIYGPIAATVTWVLINTLGETFKEAWKQSKLHDRLLNILTKEYDIGTIRKHLPSKLSNSTNTDSVIEIEAENSTVKVKVKIKDPGLAAADISHIQSTLVNQLGLDGQSGNTNTLTDSDS